MFAPLATKARPLTKSTRSKTVTDRASVVFNKSISPGRVYVRTYASRERTILAYDESARFRIAARVLKPLLQREVPGLSLKYHSEIITF